MAPFVLVSNVSLTNALIWSLFVASFSAVLVSSVQFHVGGEKGWVGPTGNETETYNQWAAKNRFRIGDTIYFKYDRDGDSVLVVNSSAYENCITSNPIYQFEDGNTVFEFERSGFFYFISGEPGHCKAGQKLIIRVMHPFETEAPEAAPSPESPTGGGGGDHGEDSHNVSPPTGNFTSKLSVASCLGTFLGGLFVILCWWI